MEGRVAADPYDTDAWVTLLQEAAQQTPDEYRPLFERCVQHFPSAAICWYQWLEIEMRAGDAQMVETIFERCLTTVHHIELWKLYLQYLKLEKRCSSKELEQAYKMVLIAVGADVDAGPQWIEYVTLLRDAVEPGSANHSMVVAAAREGFRLALMQPVMGLEPLWAEYEAWELAQSGQNRDLATSTLAEVSDAALVARRVARERRALITPLRLREMPRLPRGTPAELSQLRAWRALWEYEATNPQRLEPAALQARMQFTFNWALMAQWFTPQVWHEAAMWMHSNGHRQSAQGFYQRALEVLPASEVLAIAYARMEEADGNSAMARGILEKLVAATPTPIAYITLMRLVRRTEGAEAGRRMFARARRADTCTWHVYAAAAQLEYQLGAESGGEVVGEGDDGGVAGSSNGSVVSSRILMLALERFPGEPALALHAVRFLLERNDVANARAVLERSLPNPACSASRELWRTYLELEMTFGSAASVRPACASAAEWGCCTPGALFLSHALPPSRVARNSAPRPRLASPRLTSPRLASTRLCPGARCRGAPSEAPP